MTGSLKSDLDRLRDVLDAFGADRARWPLTVRRELSALLSVSEAARALVTEAESFDRLLDQAPVVAADRVAALSDRIVAMTRTTPRIVTQAPPLRTQRVAPVLRRHAAGIAALAASLMIGIFVGQSSSVQPAMNELAALAGLEVAATTSAQRTDEADASLDGELL